MAGRGPGLGDGLRAALPPEESAVAILAASGSCTARGAQMAGQGPDLGSMNGGLHFLLKNRLGGQEVITALDKMHVRCN
eukprot:12658379-Heterocapsa_arctica.AAC.1